MATIKSFTSLEQSKKLAEILPIESADMVIWGKDLDAIMATNAQKLMKGLKDRKMNYIPCWSLSALLNVINQVKEIKYQRVTMLVGRFAGQHWYVELLRVQDEKSVLFEHSKELVDACMEMILKLHELKLL